jgi:hypothetical protein
MAETFTRASVGVGAAEGVDEIAGVPDAELVAGRPPELPPCRATDAKPHPPNVRAMMTTMTITMRRRRAVE